MNFAFVHQDWVRWCTVALTVDRLDLGVIHIVEKLGFVLLLGRVNTDIDVRVRANYVQFVVQLGVKFTWPITTFFLIESTTRKRIFFLVWRLYRVSQKKCPGHTWYFNDNLIYAHLHHPHVGFATFILLVLNLCEVNDVSMHKLNYHWHVKVWPGHSFGTPCIHLLWIFSKIWVFLS